MTDRSRSDPLDEGKHFVHVALRHTQRSRGGQMFVDVLRAIDGQRGAEGSEFFPRSLGRTPAPVWLRSEFEGLPAHSLGCTAAHADCARHSGLDSRIGSARSRGGRKMISSARATACRNRHGYRHQFLVQRRNRHCCSPSDRREGFAPLRVFDWDSAEIVTFACELSTGSALATSQSAVRVAVGECQHQTEGCADGRDPGSLRSSLPPPLASPRAQRRS
jgi:hypothetical protein